MFLWIVRIILFLPLWILHPTFIKGKKNLPKGKAILCANHRSNWDITLWVLNYPKKVKILAKKELFKNKLLGAILKNFGAIAIERDSNDLNAIKLCFKALKEGKKLFVFPEGTRLKDESQVLGEIKSGVAMIAIKTKTPIVPIWINKKPRIFRKSVYYIGNPFELNQFYGKKLDEQALAEANEIVKNKILEVRENSLKK